MATDNEYRSPIFNYPVLLTFTVILCLVSYQAFGVNTAIGVATCSSVLTFLSLKRKSKPSAELN